MGKQFNKTLGGAIVAANDEAFVAEEELAEIENLTISEFLEYQMNTLMGLGRFIEDHPEYEKLNAMEFYQKVFNGEIEV